MIAPPPVSELNTVTALLAVIADPKRSAEALAGIKAGADEYRALAEKTAEDRAAADAKVAEAEATAAANSRVLADLGRERAEVNAKLAKAADELKALNAGFKSLDEQNAELAARADAFEKSAAVREAALALRENDILAREAKAEGLIAEYEEKLAKLKSIAG
jgi:uncharacterized coiled-coil protein SlyX